MGIILNSLFILIFSVLVIFSAYSSLTKKTESKKSDFVVKINNFSLPKKMPSSPASAAVSNKTVFVTQPSIKQPIQAPIQNKIQTFSTSVSYAVPNSTQSMSVSITVSGSVITNVSLSQSLSGGTSKNYQQKFQDNYKSFVIGKNIKSINLSRIAGASLTTNAFQRALNAIKPQIL